MNTKMKLAGIMLGAALTSTAAFAGNASCGAGKCGGDVKKTEKKASCGAGKCGADMKKDMKKASCGAGKCGADMKKEAK